MSAQPDPVWGDDFMAIVNAIAPAHPELDARFLPHPCHAREFTDLALELTLDQWVAENVPIDLVPTEHDLRCHGCDAVLCGCLDQCEDLERDVCSHWGKPFCGDCSVHRCPECRSDVERWGR